MTIQIIEEGENPDNPKMYGTCPKCKTKFKCLKTDTKVLHGNFGDNARFVLCPTCNTWTPVEIPIRG